MKKKITYELRRFIDISPYTEDYEVVTSALGYDKKIYILLVNKTPERMDGMFVQSKTSSLFTYKVLTIAEDGKICETSLSKQRYNYHFIQPINDDNLLVVGARTRYFGPDNYELNGKIFDLDGNLIKELLLGDGIQNVQVSANGTIWTGFFDEGVFGNYGWVEPIGASGLIGWDRNGKQVFSNHKADICDCYALNVVNDQEIWFYYYTDFHLVKIANDQMEFFNPKISGSSGFITYNSYFLFDKGYGKHDEYILLKNNNSGKFIQKCEVRFITQEGKTIQSYDRDFRGDVLILREGDCLYKVHLHEIVNRV
ncbi:hypothetical protein [Brevibacillus laterosporus]|uniref:hypothetical protein n=1 Tax=Brevibacillus laterosporus TaxID=1465 RepID=UPI0018CD0EEB|nr:hypothetical protein [Brevibacillus laterosporus]MBG9790455.1 hypothetical protein [Brevibacillus laterosporus]